MNDDGDLDQLTPDLDVLDRLHDGLQDGNAIVDMGAYEFVPPPCPWDCQSTPNGVIDINDLLGVLGQWGEACTSCDMGLASFGVGVGELLEVLGRWGQFCPGESGSPPESLQDAVEDAGLVWPDEWNEFYNVMTDNPPSTQAQKNNYACWMDHYLDCHPLGWFCYECYCQICPDDDPYGGH